ncbi:MAG: rhomboid family intramembrane serine protease [Caldilineaceae bacterium]|nr:rhomboid family intramembrane serine protease [Caldilineaceae bacterium]HRJ43560.1 rhomboid family intramembrane serine protease [Caldilineaceae bacterium]
MSDTIRAHRTPWVTYFLLVVNIGVFGLLAVAGLADYDEVIRTYGLIPFRFMRSFDLEAISDLLTSMFLHGSLIHLGSNMLYLWIFGDNVEDALGPLSYLFFYLMGGLVASLAHILANPASRIPTVGASGAIAAVLGAYLVLYPASQVRTLIPLGFFVRIALLPASVVLGLWFVIQLFQGFLSFGISADVGGVAVWAHVGGFVMGAVLAWLIVPRRSKERWSNR